MAQFTYEKLDHPDVLRVLFHPRRALPGETAAGVAEQRITVAEGVQVGLRLHLAGNDAANLLFFHGNGEIAADYDDIGPAFTARGMSFLVVDYRGYGSSGGQPTAGNLMVDSHLILRHVRQWLTSTDRSGPLFVMGRSLGSAPAIELAAAFPEEIKGLIIDSGFAQTLPLLMTLGVDIHALGMTEADGFGNVQKIGKATMATLIIHGQLDQLIPATSAEILQAASAARNKEFQLVPGADHNTILAVAGDRYFDALARFINHVRQIRPRRYRKETKHRP